MIKLIMDQKVCVIKNVSYRVNTDTQTDTLWTDKSLKTEWPMILLNDIFVFKTVIIGGPIICLSVLTKSVRFQRDRRYGPLTSGDRLSIYANMPGWVSRDNLVSHWYTDRLDPYSSHFVVDSRYLTSKVNLCFCNNSCLASIMEAQKSRL